MIINVKNTNDNAPTFVPGSPIVHVSEAVAIGTKVVKFNATDEDGNKLTFSISKGNTNDALVLDKDTGLLTTKTKLDREKVARYNLTVTVTELTTNQRTAQSSSQNLSVIVTDENDNMPIFDPEQYNMTVNENEPAGRLAIDSFFMHFILQNAKILAFIPWLPEVVTLKSHFKKKTFIQSESCKMLSYRLLCLASACSSLLRLDSVSRFLREN